MTQSKVFDNRSEILGQNEEKSLNERQPHGDKAAVLEQALNDNLLKDEPTVVLCPACGEIVETYEQGLPNSIPQFDLQCPPCGVSIKRWCGVAVGATYTDVVDPQELQTIVEEYWNNRVWSGITTTRGQVRNDEFANRFASKASEFGWSSELVCPLCRKTIIELDRTVSEIPERFDYHHWTEVPDRGIMLCRDCHDVITFNTCDYNVEQIAQDHGFRTRNDLQILRLAIRDAIVTGRQLRPERAEYLVDQYNLVESVGDVERIIRTVIDSHELYGNVVDESLWSNTG